MRLPPAPETGLTRRLLYAISRRKAGKLPDIAAAMGHQLKLLLAYGALEEATARSRTTDERLKALAEIKIAAMIGCEWCLDFGSKVCRHAGVSDRQLRELPNYRESDAFSPVEKLVIENYRSRFNSALGLEAQGYSEAGAVCALPERAAA